MREYAVVPRALLEDAIVADLERLLCDLTEPTVASLHRDRFVWQDGDLEEVLPLDIA